VAPTEGAEDARETWEPLTQYFEDNVDGITTEVTIVADRSAILSALQSGQADLAYDDIILLSAPDQLDVIAITEVGGSSTYFSCIYTEPR